MAKTTFRYADQDFFRGVVPDYGKFLGRLHLKEFVVDSGDRWKMYSVGTKPSMVYFDGADGTEVTKATGSITLIATGTNTTITSTGHGLSNTETVDITGTAGYDGTALVVSSVTTDTFDIVTAFGSGETIGTWTLTETATVTRVNTAKEWYYNSDEDLLYIYVATASDDPNDDERIEIGESKDTFVNQQLTNASMELNSMLDARFPIPVPPSFIYSSDPDNDTPEYDYVLKRAECLIAYSHMLQAEGDIELSEQIYAQVTNDEGTGIVDRINVGKIRLNFEKIDSDDRGRIIEGSTNAGTMKLVELSGTWTGNRYDRIKVECVTTGIYGTGEFKVYSSSSSKLYDISSSAHTVSGRFQTLSGGIEGRFEGNSMTDGDVWYFEVRNDEPTNASAGSIGLWR